MNGVVEVDRASTPGVGEMDLQQPRGRDAHHASGGLRAQPWAVA